MFPIPAHLPRKRDSDVSTKVLTKMSETSLKSLNYKLASEWVGELDTAILQTKQSIHDRVQQDLPNFENQLTTSKSVQERLRTLSSNVDNLETTLSNSETGLVPTLITTLTKHAALSQEALDAKSMHQAMSHLKQCRQETRELAKLVDQGRLPEAVQKYQRAESLVFRQEPSLRGTQVILDMQRRFRALKDKTDEQLNEAYSRSVIVNASDIIIRPSVQVRASDTVLSLPSVLSSLSQTNLSNLMTTLRRDLTTYYIDHLLSQAAAIELSDIPSMAGAMEYKLTVFPSPPNSVSLDAKVDNISKVFAFLNEHLLLRLPAQSGLSLSLCRPLSSALLHKLLIPSLPTSIHDLPKFLHGVHHVVEFEEQVIVDMLGDSGGDRQIKTWADSVATHYEKKRRVQLLERARAIVIREEDESSIFRAELAVVADSISETAIVESPVAVSQNGRTASPEETAWGFDDTETNGAEAGEEDGWGFDDDLDPASQPKAAPLEKPVTEEEEDPSDAWGWNEDDVPVEEGDDSTDSSAWDDPWGDNPEPAPTPAKPIKTASRLEKMSNKGKDKTPSVVPSPNPLAAPPPTPAMPPSSRQQKTAPQPQPPRPEIETYLVSGRAKELMFLVEDILQEARELASSDILRPYVGTSTSQVGGMISQTAALVLDLYRGLFPVVAAARLSIPKWSMRLSNDCTWLAGEIKSLLTRSRVGESTTTKLEESRRRLEQLSECWYEETIEAYTEKLNQTLDGAEGFVRTTDQNRYDDCEAAVNQVLQDIRKFSQQTKTVLPKTKYYQAIGSILNSALARILQDVLALGDITADESQKLSELCKIFNALEGLFVEDPNHPSFVVAYVPAWLKFSYLSELLEASIADISYLFEEGALVDFEIDELVNLVRALFADTPLRTNTINKLMQGHPARS